ncbi:hypothetical protein L873DRAFT_1799028, partial [Choiromyces venosus 120613-1]
TLYRLWKELVIFKSLSLNREITESDGDNGQHRFLSALVTGTIPVAALFWQVSPVGKRTKVIDKQVTLMKEELHAAKLDAEAINEKLGKMNENLLESIKAVSAAIKGKPKG